MCTDSYRWSLLVVSTHRGRPSVATVISAQNEPVSPHGRCLHTGGSAARQNGAMSLSCAPTRWLRLGRCLTRGFSMNPS